MRLRRSTMADLADRHHLYQESVQDTESEIDFVEETWADLRDRPATLLREDFCGTANTACEWVRRDPAQAAMTDITLITPTLNSAATIADCIDSSKKAINAHKPASVDDVRNSAVNLIVRGEEALGKESQLKQFLLENVYRHHRQMRMAEKSERIITTLFESYINNPEQLPPNFSSRLETEDKYVVVADYIAGMTDRFAGQEYKKMIDPFELF